MKGVVVTAVVIVLLVGAGAGYLLMRRSAAAPGTSRTNSASPEVQTAKITVTAQGFEPDVVKLRAGVPAQLTFFRSEAKTCGTEVVFPALKIERELPLNQPITIEFTPARTGEISFACGMKMMTGRIVVEQ